LDLKKKKKKKRKKSKIGERIIIFPTFAFYSFERVFSAGDSTSCLRLDGNEKEKEDKDRRLLISRLYVIHIKRKFTRDDPAATACGVASTKRRGRVYIGPRRNHPTYITTL
jgi:hypothetical protein